MTYKHLHCITQSHTEILKLPQHKLGLELEATTCGGNSWYCCANTVLCRSQLMLLGGYSDAKTQVYIST